MSHWSKDWTIETVEENYKAIRCIDPEDVFQLIEDAKELRRLYDHLGHRHMAELHQIIDESE